MNKGIVLISDRSIEISQSVQLLSFEGKWQLCYNGKLDDILWDEAVQVCKGLGILVNRLNNLYRFVWENGEYKDIKDSFRGVELVREINKFIVERVGLKGLSERAFIKIRKTNAERYERRKKADDGSIIQLCAFRSRDGWLIYSYQVDTSIYYGVINKEKTEWLVDINCGYTDVSYTPSGAMIFYCDPYIGSIEDDYDGRTHIIYNQEDIIEPFYGKLTLVNKDNDIFEYEYDKGLWSGTWNKDDALIIDGTEYRSKCLVRVMKTNVELVVDLTSDIEKLPGYISDKGFILKYYSDNFMIYGMEPGKSNKGLDGRYVGTFCGYAFNSNGDYHFNKNAILVAEGYYDITEEIRDILVYCKDKDTNVWRGMLITPSLGKVIGIRLDDIVYREEGGWLKIVSTVNGTQQFYYNGQVYKDMRLAYKVCEKVRTNSLVGQSLYACQHRKGNWTIGTQDMEPIGRRNYNWYISKEDVVREIKDKISLDITDYIRQRIDVGDCLEELDS